MSEHSHRSEARHVVRNALLSAAYAHPAAFSVFVRRGPSAARRYLMEMYRCSKTDAGLRLPVVSLGDLTDSDSDAEFSVFRPADVDGSMTITEIASLCHLVAARRPSKILEVGTFQGLTTQNIAQNAAQAEVHTLDLPADVAPEDTVYVNNDTSIIGRRGFYHFAGRSEAARITQHLGDSATFDFSVVGPGIDFCLIDAAHSYEYVRNDTVRVLPWLNNGALLLWHDYGRNDFLPNPDDAWGVTRFLHEIAEVGVGIIEGTSIGALVVTEDVRVSLDTALKPGKIAAAQ